MGCAPSVICARCFTRRKAQYQVRNVMSVPELEDALELAAEADPSVITDSFLKNVLTKQIGGEQIDVGSSNVLQCRVLENTLTKQIVGVIIFIAESLISQVSPVHVYIRAFAVKKEFRRMKLGQLLLSVWIKELRKSRTIYRTTPLITKVHNENTSGQQFFLHNQFHQTTQDRTHIRFLRLL